MKKILFTSLLALIIGYSYSQSVTETTIRKFNIGVGVSTDIWQGLAPGLDARTINQGAQVFGMYNYRINHPFISPEGLA